MIAEAYPISQEQEFDVVFERLVTEGAFLFEGTLSKYGISALLKLVRRGPNYLANTDVAKLPESLRNIVDLFSGKLESPLPMSVGLVHRSASHIPSMHIDNSITTTGLTFLVPITGPEAQFFYCEQSVLPNPKMRTWREDVERLSKTFSYGVGDVLVLRQQINHNGSIYEQILHDGLANRDRVLISIDVMADKTSELELTYSIS